MQNLKSLVHELFEQDKLLNALSKDLKTKTARYNHLLLKNTGKIYSDSELIAINALHDELNEIRNRQENILTTGRTIKDQLKTFMLPLNGGRWVHETDDPIHPQWEFWLEEDELKYAQMNGRNY
jgi:hypothetical protein